ncbi:MAG: hypothetical protein IPJ34_17850 [Myxococcales bacterium]|nr:hypothetical protein [Myxococcales bacterium]
MDGGIKDSTTSGDATDLDVVVDTTPTDGACGGATYEAKQAPASLIFVLDASDSMNTGGKWSSAALAIVSAIDSDSFDTMSLGLLASPSSQVTGPSCVLGFPVACGSPALPQIAIKPAGKDKSSASTGVRKQIYDWLAANAPKSGYDGTPLHDALKTSYNYLRLSAAKTKLIAVVIYGRVPELRLAVDPWWLHGHQRVPGLGVPRLVDQADQGRARRQGVARADLRGRRARERHGRRGQEHAAAVHLLAGSVFVREGWVSRDGRPGL